MPNDLISIIVPIYNSELYLTKCLESLINQTYKNLEILLINDGSTDKSINIMKSYQENDPRIKIIDKKNTGVSDSRNIGLSTSKGKYIMFVDSDDYLDINAIDFLYKKIRKTNADIIRYNGYIENINRKFTKIEFPVKNNLIIDTKNDKKQILDILFNPTTSIRCYTPLLFMKKSMIKEFRVELVYLEDKMFYIENFINDKKILFIDEPLYYYAFNASSKTKNINNFYNNMLDLLESMGIIEEVIADRYDVSIVKASFANLFLYRLDYLVNNSTIKDFKKTYKLLMENPKIKEIVYNDFQVGNKFKKLQQRLLTKERHNLYFYLTKIKNKLKG